MSGSVIFSQTNVAASVTITPGPGVTLSGTQPGPGYNAATVGADGHLRLTSTAGVVSDLGQVAPTIGRIALAGSTQADAAVIVATTSIIVPGVVGGGLILPGPGRWELVNRSGVDAPIYPNFGGALEQLAINLPMAVGNGERAVFVSPDALLWSAT